MDRRFIVLVTKFGGLLTLSAMVAFAATGCRRRARATVVVNSPPPAVVNAPAPAAVAWNGAPNYGSVALMSGFMPDPHAMSGTSGGHYRASDYVDRSCRGWIAQNPDHILRLQTNFGFLRIFVESNADTTLVIRTPNGQWMCNDDGGRGLNPMLQAGYWDPGDYAVWVGSYSQGTFAPYNIYFTQLPNVM